MKAAVRKVTIKTTCNMVCNTLLFSLSYYKSDYNKLVIFIAE